MNVSRSFFTAFLLAATLGFSSTSVAEGGEVSLPGGIRPEVKSIVDLRNLRVKRQKYDFSCGSAAIATLMTYSYDIPLTEEQVFSRMYEIGEKDQIHKVGFSLLDMKKYVETLGFEASGYKITFDKLRELHLPAIVLVNTGGYNHFVVMRGWEGSSVVIADPYRGLRRIALIDFEKMWNGIVFVVRDEVQLARSRFNDPNDLKIAPGAPYSTASATQDLSGFLLNLRGFNEY